MLWCVQFSLEAVPEQGREGGHVVGGTGDMLWERGGGSGGSHTHWTLSPLFKPPCLFSDICQQSGWHKSEVTLLVLAYVKV